MSAVVDSKSVKNWTRASEEIEVVYDFAKDGGAVAALDLITCKEASVVELCYMKVDTTCTSGGSATVSVGKSGDVAGMVAATAVASLTAGAVIFGAALDASHVVAADGVIQLDIAVAALTAGKITVRLRISKF
jgi:hypothetical protein